METAITFTTEYISFVWSVLNKREYQYHKEKSEFLYLEIWEQCIYKAFLA